MHIMDIKGPLRGPGSEGSKGSKGSEGGGGGFAAGCVEGLWKKVLKMDGSSTQGFLSLTALRAEGFGIALTGDEYYNAAFRRSCPHRVS